MAKKEWVVALSMFIFGLLFAAESLRLGLGSVRRPGEGFLPFGAGCGLSLVSLYFLINNFLKLKREPGTKREKFLAKRSLNVVAIILALGVYVLILPYLGYLLSTFLLFIFLFKAIGFRRWTFILLAALLTVSISYVVFGSWLNIRFPKGLIGL